MLSIQQAETILQSADLIYSAEQVSIAFDELALRIDKDYSGRNPLVLCVMKGGIFATSHLLTRLTFPLEFDYIHVTRYRNTSVGADVEWKVKPETELNGRDVLIIDDIYDEGVTLKEILKYCDNAGANNTAVVVLADKQHNRKQSVLVPDYVALQIPDRYVVGCGMDYQGYFRNLPAIYAINE